ncbi:hypothetical protein [Ferrovibrio sp.]|uniref:hypothetical protein n=1 Tax=Ferrovibrio sp. TaxID=1917215 RepID=UPI003513A34A
MTGDDLVWLAIPARGIATALFVGGVIWLMERASPFIGGIVLALPIVTAPAYLFLLVHDGPAFASHAALGSLATIGAVQLFLAVVIALLARLPMTFALPAALATWTIAAAGIRLLPAALPVSLAVFATAALLAWTAGRRVPLTAPAARGRSPVYEVALRGAAAGLLVAFISGTADLLGPRIAGILASFPVALLVVCLFMPRRLETAGMRAALRATQYGLLSHVPFFLSLILLPGRLGGVAGFVIGIAGSLAVALLLAMLRRLILRRQAVKPQPA